MPNERSIDITWGSLWRILVVVGVAFALFLSIDILTAVFLALIISTSLSAPVSFLERLHIPRVIGAIFVFLIILSFFGALVYAVAPLAIEEANRVLEQFFPLFSSWFNFDP